LKERKLFLGQDDDAAVGNSDQARDSEKVEKKPASKKRKKVDDGEEGVEEEAVPKKKRSKLNSKVEVKTEEYEEEEA
jgi:hypothetical protein